MKKTLFTWLGNTDIRAAEGEDLDEFGPIGQAVITREYEKIAILNNFPKNEATRYVRWLRGRTNAEITSYQFALPSPTAFGAIYEAAVEVLTENCTGVWDKEQFEIHLSPGTPAMAAVWIILCKTQFPATLLESSRDHGVKVASVPFDISADYIPEMLRKPDDDLIRLSQGLPPESPEFDDIVHRCTHMQEVISRARRVAIRSVPVLIMGESGTGKELLARAIHRASAVSQGPLVTVNCGAIPENLIESELFGHEKGAFTGASVKRIGHVESANNGTLFLDEIGELPSDAQVKLLRVLQEKEVTRLGASRPTKVEFRVIAATNRNLIEEVAEGTFREDLFHRLAVAILRLPPLRERGSDLSLLIDTLMELINEEAASQPGFVHKKISIPARNLLKSHDWPGNIRELYNTLQRAAVWSVRDTIQQHDIEESILPMKRRGADSTILNRPLGKDLDLQAIIDDVAKHYLTRAMKEAGGNKTRAADLVGLPSYQTLSNWLKKYGVV